MENIYNPNYYSKLESDSAMIQAAVDAAAKDRQAVTIPKFNERTKSNVWIIEKSIKLHSGSVVYLDNCTLRYAEGVYENIFTNSNYANGEWKNPAGRQKTIHIYGLGEAVIENSRHNDLNEYTHNKDGLPNVYNNSAILFVNAEDIIIDNLKIIDHRYWALNFSYCAYGRISNIRFYALHKVINQDGIDLRTGCNNFIIENITGVTGDDTVALTCLWSRFDEDMKKLGYDDSIHNVIIRNIYSTTPCGLVRLLNHHKKKLYNITIENVGDIYENPDFTIIDEEMAKFRPGACIRIGENNYYTSPKSNQTKAQPEDTYNITVRNINSHGRMAVRAACALKGALFEDIKVYGDGGTAVYFGEGCIKDVIVRDIIYSPDHNPNPLDDNRIENHYNQNKSDRVIPDREVCAVYFKETEAERIIFSNIYASDKLSAVFGGNGSVTMKAENIFADADKVPVFLNENLKVKELKSAL